MKPYRIAKIKIYLKSAGNGYKRGNVTKFDPPPREVLRVMKPGESVIVKTESHRFAYYNAGIFLFGRSGRVASKREGKGWRIWLVNFDHFKKQEPLV